MTDKAVYVVDDDGAVRRSLDVMLRLLGYKVTAYVSAEAFLSAVGMLPPGCVLVDLRLPGMDGLLLQSRLAELGASLPVIVLTGHGDVPTAVRAMRAGALSFLEKPFEKHALIEAIQEAHASLGAVRDQAVRQEAARARIAALTGRERDVLVRLLDGLSNKAIAQNLGISPRTVEIHRAHMMERLGTRSLSDALQIALAANLER